MNDDIVIKIDSVYKDFSLPHERSNSFKSAFTGMLKGKKNRTIEKQHALGGVSFEVKKGEFFGIVGRNGSGKSTLLKIIAQIYQPTKGTVNVDGRLVPFIELGVGFNTELTGRENVYLSASLMGFSKKEINSMYNEIVEFAELEKFMDQKLKNYSSGMQVRLAFSIATRAKGDILLIDEVLAVGDADFQRKCFDYFRELKKDKKTVVFVTHDMAAVREYCDRVVLVEKSKIILEGKASDVAPEYTKMFENNENTTSDSEKRWGDGALVIKNATLSTKKLTEEDISLQLTLLLKAHEDLSQDSVAGFNIRRSDGNVVQGINTKMQNRVMKPLKKGQEITITWEIPNIFEDDKHFVTLSVTSSDFSRNHDWHEDALSFRSYRQQRTPYVVAPSGIQLRVSDNEDLWDKR